MLHSTHLCVFDGDWSKKYFVRDIILKMCKRTIKDTKKINKDNSKYFLRFASIADIKKVAKLYLDYVALRLMY